MTRLYSGRAADKFCRDVQRNPYDLGSPTPSGLAEEALAAGHTASYDVAYDLISRMVDGELTNEQIDHIVKRGPYDSFLETMYARGFATQWSWFLFGQEWLDDIARIVRGRHVLELFAGNGWVARLMQQRGVDWLATDVKPGNDWVVEYDVEQFPQNFLESSWYLDYDFDIIFASWIPYGSALDALIASYGKPMIVVGEGFGGCTGSEEFWAKYGAAYVTEVYPGFHDVPQWDGIHDGTWLVNWPGVETYCCLTTPGEEKEAVVAGVNRALDELEISEGDVREDFGHHLRWIKPRGL